MTPEALTQARIQEAIRTVGPKYGLQKDEDHAAEVCLALIRLVEADWRPVDPLLLEARKIASVHSVMGITYTNGHGDKSALVVASLAALKRGIEIGEMRAATAKMDAIAERVRNMPTPR